MYDEVKPIYIYINKVNNVQPNSRSVLTQWSHCTHRSVNCCSARPRKLFAEQFDKEKDGTGRESPASSCNSTTNAYVLPEDVWLECDDEVIRVLRMRELEDLLSRKQRTSALTPYLLFYAQVSSRRPSHSSSTSLCLGGIEFSNIRKAHYGCLASTGVSLHTTQNRILFTPVYHV